MASFMLQLDSLLRGRAELRLTRLLSFIVSFGLIYGMVMGTSAGIAGERALQPLYSAVKVPLLLLVTFLLSLPSFFVLNTLMGLRSDFPEALRALTATQAALTIILASFAPFTALWYASSSQYDAAVLFNAAMFGLASISAQFLLRRFYAPLIARDRRHKWLLRAWIIVYAFAGIQMGWVLRPFVGDPRTPTEFFRDQALSNAYIEVIHKAERAAGFE
jgi:hypothetical protein